MSENSQNGPQDPNTPKNPTAPQTPPEVPGDAKPFYLRVPVMAGAAIAVVAIIAAVAFTGASTESVTGSTQEAKAETADQDGAAADWALGSHGDIVMGSRDAPVKMVEYASMTCPHCAVFNLAVFPDIKKKYIDTGLVQYTLREFPTPPATLSIAAFMLARCAGEERYYKAVDALFRTQRTWVQADPRAARAALEKIALQFGLDKQKFATCIDNEPEFERIRQVMNAGHEVFGITGTPSFVVNGRKANIHAPTFEALDSLIKERLPKGTKVPDYKPAGYQEPAAEESGNGSDESAAEAKDDGDKEAADEAGATGNAAEASGEKATDNNDTEADATKDAAETTEKTPEKAAGEDTKEGDGSKEAAGDKPADQ